MLEALTRMTTTPAAPAQMTRARLNAVCAAVEAALEAAPEIDLLPPGPDRGAAVLRLVPPEIREDVARVILAGAVATARALS